MNKNQAIGMLSFIADLYNIVQEANMKEAAQQVAEKASNGRGKMTEQTVPAQTAE